MTVTHNPDSHPDPLPDRRPSSPRHRVVTLLGCLLLGLLTGAVTNWEMAVSVFLASIALFTK